MIMKNLSYFQKKKKKSRARQTFIEDLQPILLKQFQKIETERTLLNSFHKANTILIPKPRYNRKRRPVSLMNINSKIPNKTFANRIQLYIKKIFHHDKIGSIYKMQR